MPRTPKGKEPLNDYTRMSQEELAGVETLELRHDQRRLIGKLKSDVLSKRLDMTQRERVRGALGRVTAELRRRAGSGELIVPQSRGGTGGSPSLTISKSVSQKSNRHLGVVHLQWTVPENLSQNIRLANGIEKNFHHLTLAYLKHPDGIDAESPREDVAKAVAAAAQVARGTHSLHGNLSGTTRFTGGEQDANRHPYVLSASVPGLHQLHEDLSAAIAQHTIFEPAQEHGFVPHVTLGYLHPDDPTPGHLVESVPIHIDHIEVHTPDGATHRFPLQGGNLQPENVQEELSGVEEATTMIPGESGGGGGYGADNDDDADAGSAVIMSGKGPQALAAAHYRLAAEGAPDCLDCAFFTPATPGVDGPTRAGHCRMFDVPAEADHVCDRWVETVTVADHRDRTRLRRALADLDDILPDPGAYNMPSPVGAAQKCMEEGCVQEAELALLLKSGEYIATCPSHADAYRKLMFRKSTGKGNGGNAISMEIVLPKVGDDGAVFKALAEERYTFAPLYAPDRLDAHGEYAKADEIQHSVWDYVRRGDRRIRLEHQAQNYAPVIGEWVEIVCWPQPVTITLVVPGSGARTVTLPAGTAWMGVIWTPAAWPLVKSGRLGGLSVGGRTKRRMGRNAPTQDMGWQKTPRVQKSSDLITGAPVYARDPAVLRG